MHICTSVSKGCININSFGVICVRCGCCEEYNPDVIDRMERQIKYYKERLEEQNNFKDFSSDEYMATLQVKNIESNKVFYKNKIYELEQALELLKEQRGCENERHREHNQSHKVYEEG